MFAHEFMNHSFRVRHEWKSDGTGNGITQVMGVGAGTITNA